MDKLRVLARRTPLAGVNTQPGLALITIVNGEVQNPFNLVSPSGNPAPPAQIQALTLGPICAPRTIGENATVSVRGKANPASGDMTLVLRGATTFTKTILFSANWKAEITDVPPGDYVLSVRYSSDSAGSGSAQFITVR